MKFSLHLLNLEDRTEQEALQNMIGLIVKWMLKSLRRRMMKLQLRSCSMSRQGRTRPL